MSRLSLIGLLVLALAAGARAAVGAAVPRPPNIVFILADDLGYGDLGCYGQEKIRTPRLDRLAREGMRFTRHYSGSPVCAPSRCVLMTGLHPGHTAVRDNREAKPEGQFPLPAGTVTLPRLLQQAGYVTGGFGKWGLGGPETEGRPLRQGFDRFYGFNCQRAAHNYYPTHLWEDDRPVALDNPAFEAHQELPQAAGLEDPASYVRYAGRQYAPDLIHEQARRFVREHRRRPFFLYVPTTVPHLALQVPEDSLREYRGRWPDPPYTGDRKYLPHPFPRAAYAAMVTRMDREVGRLVDLVRELGLEKDTLFVFTSDNGPLYDRLGGTDEEFFRSSGGLRGRKGSLYEGGFRVPLVVRWTGKVPPGTRSGRVCGFEDWLPTLLELAGARDRVPAGLDGISMAPTLLGRSQPERPLLYREFPAYGGQQLVRTGDWVGIRQGLKPAGGRAPAPRWELYDLAADPRQERDVAAAHPEVTARLARLAGEQRRPSPDFPIPALDAP